MKPESKINEEELRKAVTGCAEYLCTQKHSVGIHFNILDTENIGYLFLEGKAGDPEWDVRVSVRNQNNDWMASNYVWLDCYEAIIEKLHTQEGKNEIMESIVQLSARVDEHERYGE